MTEWNINIGIIQSEFLTVDKEWFGWHRTRVKKEITKRTQISSTQIPGCVLDVDDASNADLKESNH